LVFGQSRANGSHEDVPARRIISPCHVILHINRQRRRSIHPKETSPFTGGTEEVQMQERQRGAAHQRADAHQSADARRRTMTKVPETRSATSCRLDCPDCWRRSTASDWPKGSAGLLRSEEAIVARHTCHRCQLQVEQEEDAHWNLRAEWVRTKLWVAKRATPTGPRSNGPSATASDSSNDAPRRILAASVDDVSYARASPNARSKVQASRRSVLASAADRKGRLGWMMARWREKASQESSLRLLLVPRDLWTKGIFNTSCPNVK
jgi:hypothetical protein